MSDLVLTQVIDRVALITVNDPDRRNAVTAEMSAGLRAAMEVEGWRHRSGDDPVRSALARIGARVRAAQATPG